MTTAHDLHHFHRDLLPAMLRDHREALSASTVARLPRLGISSEHDNGPA